MPPSRRSFGLGQPTGLPVLVEIIGGDLTTGKRQDMIAQITDLVAETLRLPDRSLVTVLSMTPVEQLVSAERQHDMV
jgi:phenylpyruvate tautomerase PptA (4-oxalocrotonate tautomerase family)